jgi:hypothetical protein
MRAVSCARRRRYKPRNARIRAGATDHVPARREQNAHANDSPKSRDSSGAKHNTPESYASSVTSGYQPLERMQALLTAPDGFSLALSTDGKSYLFSLKDKTDACRFPVFSDQGGLIHQEGPLQ